jgi:hypothetical protein
VVPLDAHGQPDGTCLGVPDRIGKRFLHDSEQTRWRRPRAIGVFRRDVDRRAGCLDCSPRSPSPRSGPPRASPGSRASTAAGPR